MNAEIAKLARQFHISVLSSPGHAIDWGLAGEECVLSILRAEAAAREERATKERLRKARLPANKAFSEFDTEFQKGVSAEQLDALAKLEWIDALYNLILIGPPGTGKTHIALAIGNKAARSGYNVAFHTMDGIVHTLKTNEISRKSQACLGWIKKCDLLVIDDMGYLPISKIEANLFFSLISELYERISIVITSNKGFDGWAETLGDPVLATALLDRLTHRCQIISLTGESYRLKHRESIFR